MVSGIPLYEAFEPACRILMLIVYYTTPTHTTAYYDIPYFTLPSCNKSYHKCNMLCGVWGPYTHGFPTYPLLYYPPKVPPKLSVFRAN